MLDPTAPGMIIAAIGTLATGVIGAVGSLIVTIRKASKTQVGKLTKHVKGLENRIILLEQAIIQRDLHIFALEEAITRTGQIPIARPWLDEQPKRRRAR